MEKKIIVAVPTYNSIASLKAAIDTYNTGSVRPDLIWIYDHSAEKTIAAQLAEYAPNTVFYDHHRGNCVSAAWNHALRQIHDGIETLIIANDDIIPQTDSVKEIVAIAKQATALDKQFWYAGEGANAWSFFVQTRTLFDTIGPYDENFKPAYFEDNDYHYRMKLHGFDITHVPECKVTHYQGGSQTLQLLDEESRAKAHRTFHACKNYYMMKWGGIPGNEIYTSAFNQ